MFVCKLLQRFHLTFDLVFGNFAFHFLQILIGVPAGIAHRHTEFFAYFVDHFDHFFASFFRQLGKGNAYDGAVGVGIDAQIRFVDGLFYGFQGAFVIGLDDQASAVGGVDVGAVGVTEAEAADDDDVPAVFDAVAVKV